MSSHHDHHDHVTESKPVSFTAPLISGIITVFAIILLVSLGNPHHCECDQACDSECAEKCGHDAEATHEKHAVASHEMKAEEEAVTTPESVKAEPVTDSVVKTEVKMEEAAHPAEEAHH